MSWDIFVQDLPPGIKSTDQIPNGLKPRPLGSRVEIIQRLRDVAPDLIFNGPSLGNIKTSNYEIEISMSDGDPISSFAFHLYGGDEGARRVGEILSKMRLHALAPGAEGGIFDPQHPEVGLRKHRDYVDRVLKKKSE